MITKCRPIYKVCLLSALVVGLLSFPACSRGSDGDSGASVVEPIVFDSQRVVDEAVQCGVELGYGPANDLAVELKLAEGNGGYGPGGGTFVDPVEPDFANDETGLAEIEHAQRIDDLFGEEGCLPQARAAELSRSGSADLASEDLESIEELVFSSPDVLDAEKAAVDCVANEGFPNFVDVAGVSSAVSRIRVEGSDTSEQVDEVEISVAAGEVVLRGAEIEVFRETAERCTAGYYVVLNAAFRREADSVAPGE